MSLEGSVATSYPRKSGEQEAICDIEVAIYQQRTMAEVPKYQQRFMDRSAHPQSGVNGIETTPVSSISRRESRIVGTMPPIQLSAYSDLPGCPWVSGLASRRFGCVTKFRQDSLRYDTFFDMSGTQGSLWYVPPEEIAPTKRYGMLIAEERREGNAPVSRPRWPSNYLP